MSFITPFWFKQRQCKAEPHGGETMLKVTGPNLVDAYLHIHPAEQDLWKAGLRLTPDGPDVATADAPGPTAKSAWAVAFELYRGHVIV